MCRVITLSHYMSGDSLFVIVQGVAMVILKYDACDVCVWLDH